MPDVMIYGGCVSRDTKGIFPKEWDMSTYIARQSVISAASGPVDLPGESKLTSKFQQRMVAADVAGDALDTIRANIDDADLFLFDLIIDRRGIFEVTPGNYVSRSDEMIQSRLLYQQLTKARWIDFATDEHFNIWSQAMTQLLDILRSSETLSLFVAPRWAEYDNEGNELVYVKRPVSEWNKDYERYYQFIVDAGIERIDIPAELAIGDVNHVWGLTPFHFIPEAYESIRDQILGRYNQAVTH